MSAKTVPLNAALFAEEGAAMTTGEISAIKHSTPQYWFDSKTNQLVVEHSGGGVNVGEDVGSIPEKSHNSGRNARTKIPEQETGLRDDRYTGEVQEYARSSIERDSRVKQYARQEAQTVTIEQVYNGSTILTDKDWVNIINQFGRDNDPRKILPNIMPEMLDQFTWLHVRMPSQFGYTGAIQLNSAVQGLEHSFLRHSDEWRQYIPGLNDCWQRIPGNIRRLIKKIGGARSRGDTEIAIVELYEDVEELKLTPQTYNELRLVLLKIQMKIHEFIQNNLTASEYLEHGVNHSDHIQVYFSVRDTRDIVGVMVVCVSDQLFPRVDEFDDRRPVRTITTVFFKSENDFNNSKIRAGKAWP